MEIIASKELYDRLQASMSDFRRHCGIIFSVNDSNDASKRGTVTFANISGVDGILTAYHVYAQLINQDTRIYCSLKEQRISVPEAQIYSEKLDYVWLPIKGFRDLELDSVSFFDTTNAHNISQIIYDDYYNVDPDSAAQSPSNFLIHGSPNYACSGDNSLMGLQAIHVSLRQFHYQSISGKNPQIRFEFDSGQLAVNDDNIERRYRQYFQSDRKDSAFGGYSGGPMCIFGIDCFFLIGITVECKSFDDLFMGIASPISLIIDEISSHIRP